MTDDELRAEVQAMRQGGQRGEVDAVEGTPEGTYLWATQFNAPSLTSLVFRPMVGYVYYAFAVSNPFMWRQKDLSLAIGVAPHPA